MTQKQLELIETSHNGQVRVYGNPRVPLHKSPLRTEIDLAGGTSVHVYRNVGLQKGELRLGPRFSRLEIKTVSGIHRLKFTPDPLSNPFLPYYSCSITDGNGSQKSIGVGWGARMDLALARRLFEGSVDDPYATQPRNMVSEELIELIGKTVGIDGQEQI